MLFKNSFQHSPLHSNDSEISANNTENNSSHQIHSHTISSLNGSTFHTHQLSRHDHYHIDNDADTDLNTHTGNYNTDVTTISNLNRNEYGSSSMQKSDKFQNSYGNPKGM